jgi:hypothetical protein
MHIRFAEVRASANANANVKHKYSVPNGDTVQQMKREQLQSKSKTERDSKTRYFRLACREDSCL